MYLLYQTKTALYLLEIKSKRRESHLEKLQYLQPVLKKMLSLRYLFWFSYLENASQCNQGENGTMKLHARVIGQHLSYL